MQHVQEAAAVVQLIAKVRMIDYRRIRNVPTCPGKRLRRKKRSRSACMNEFHSSCDYFFVCVTCKNHDRAIKARAEDTL